MEWNSQFDTFMPHGMCLLWRPELMSLHIISDMLIATAYFTIPFSILRFARGRDDLDRRHVALASLFAVFIALCGLTHVVSIIVLWLPVYIIEGWLKAATAVVSIATAAWLIVHVGDVIKLPSIKMMQREISARRQSEAELRVAEHDLRHSLTMLRTVIEVVPGLVYAKDHDGRMLLANKDTLDLIGAPWTEVEGKTDIEFLRDRHQAEILMLNDQRIMNEGRPEELEETVDHPKKGTRIYLSTKAPFEDGVAGISGMVGFSIDITGRKKVDEEFLHVARRTAMGDMAAAIAHEINQPLAAIAMYIEGSLSLLERDGYEGPLVQSLAVAKDQCMRAGEIIRRVRSFVSGGEDIKQSENIPLLVDEACSLALLGTRDSGVVVSIDHASADIHVFVDRVQIEQVIVNLVRNAMDAMGNAKGMSLCISTGYDTAGMAVVSVRDSGPGISAEVAGRLFEPFVSTKGVKGMGVGLSVCRTIIENHGGKIWVDSTGKSGTSLRFNLPSRDHKLAA